MEKIKEFQNRSVTVYEFPLLFYKRADMNNFKVERST